MVLSDSDVHSLFKITNVSHSCGRNLDLLDFFSRVGRIGFIAPAGHANGLDFYFARIRPGKPRHRHGDGSHRDFRLDAVDLSRAPPGTEESLGDHSPAHSSVSRSLYPPKPRRGPTATGPDYLWPAD